MRAPMGGVLKNQRPSIPAMMITGVLQKNTSIHQRRHLVRGKSRHFGHQRHRHALSEHVPRRGAEALLTTFLDALFTTFLDALSTTFLDAFLYALSTTFLDAFLDALFVPFLAGVFLQGGDAVQSLFSELVKAAARAPSA